MPCCSADASEKLCCTCKQPALADTRYNTFNHSFCSGMQTHSHLHAACDSRLAARLIHARKAPSAYNNFSWFCAASMQTQSHLLMQCVLSGPWVPGSTCVRLEVVPKYHTIVCLAIPACDRALFSVLHDFCLTLGTCCALLRHTGVTHTHTYRHTDNCCAAGSRTALRQEGLNQDASSAGILYCSL